MPVTGSNPPSPELVLAREIQSMREAVEANTAEVKLMRTAASNLRDDVIRIDGRVRQLEREAIERVIAANRKPPLIPWRLFLCSLAAAVLAVAGSFLVH